MTAWVVVGAGSAGCVVAGRLAEAGHTVTLVEAGSAVPGRAVGAASFFEAMAEPGRLFPGSFARGRGVGGSSAVNGMIATAGEPAQYADWGWHDAIEAFARVRVPLERPDDDELGPVDRALLAAAPDAEVVTLTRRAGHRVTAADAYLSDVSVDVVGDTTVTGLRLDGPAGHRCRHRWRTSGGGRADRARCRRHRIARPCSAVSVERRATMPACRSRCAYVATSTRARS